MRSRTLSWVLFSSSWQSQTTNGLQECTAQGASQDEPRATTQEAQECRQGKGRSMTTCSTKPVALQWTQGGSYWTTCQLWTCSTMASSCLTSTRPTPICMAIHCNAGVTTTNLVGDLPGFGMVWYHPNGITNILSLARVKERYWVMYDSIKANEFKVHKEYGTVWTFKQSPWGLNFLDMVGQLKEGRVLVTTVVEKKSNYSDRDYSQAVLAHRIQNMIGWQACMTTWRSLMETC